MDRKSLTATQARELEHEIQRRIEGKMKMVVRGMLLNAAKGGYGIILAFEDDDEELGIIEVLWNKLQRAGCRTYRQQHPGGPRLQVSWSSGV